MSLGLKRPVKISVAPRTERCVFAQLATELFVRLPSDVRVNDVRVYGWLAPKIAFLRFCSKASCAIASSVAIETCIVSISFCETILFELLKDSAKRYMRPSAFFAIVD